MAKTTLYKVTDSENCTRNRMEWGPGITNSAKGSKNKLCTNGVIHAYTSPHLATIFYPSHAGFFSPVLWVSEGSVIANDGSKVGCKKLTTLYKMKFPVVSSSDKIRFALLCMKHITNPSKEDYLMEWVLEQLDSPIITKNITEKFFILEKGERWRHTKYSRILRSLLLHIDIPLLYADLATAAHPKLKKKGLTTRDLIEEACRIGSE